MSKHNILRLWKNFIKMVLYNNYKIIARFKFSKISSKEILYCFLESLILITLGLFFIDQVEIYPFNNITFYLIYFFINFLISYSVNRWGDKQEFLKRYICLSAASIRDGANIALIITSIFPFIYTIILSLSHNTKLLYEYDKLMGDKINFSYVFYNVFLIFYLFCFNRSMAFVSSNKKNQNKDSF